VRLLSGRFKQVGTDGRPGLLWTRKDRTSGMKMQTEVYQFLGGQ
jgi:hypothetical protein